MIFTHFVYESSHAYDQFGWLLDVMLRQVGRARFRRGYWAKPQAGKAVSNLPLPAAGPFGKTGSKMALTWEPMKYAQV